MKIVEYQKGNYTIKNMIISHRFIGYPNIVCSGEKIYQLPCQIGNKSYGLKELTQKYHCGMIIYLIESKRISIKILKNLAYRVTNDDIILSAETNCPF
jgi:hypothetical protein